jgi:hypothetical protein
MFRDYDVADILGSWPDSTIATVVKGCKCSDRQLINIIDNNDHFTHPNTCWMDGFGKS